MYLSGARGGFRHVQRRHFKAWGSLRHRAWAGVPFIQVNNSTAPVHRGREINTSLDTGALKIHDIEEGFPTLGRNKDSLGWKSEGEKS